MQLITGNTYPVKDKIKALGGRWNAPRQGWEVSDDNAAECRKLVAEAPISSRSNSTTREKHLRSRYSRYGSNVTRFAGGALIIRNQTGKCEDAPCCGCCS